ncbi:hypothetical protein SD78_2947 [Bacillus badius]|nr:hypothetical protein SD78_2947 [Bacillus badius]
MGIGGFSPFYSKESQKRPCSQLFYKLAAGLYRFLNIAENAQPPSPFGHGLTITVKQL